MKRRFHCTEELKKEYVALVVSGYRTEHVAREHGMSPSTLQRWVRQYWDEVQAEMVKKKQQVDQITKDSQDLQKRYDQAMKLLGEKDLEIAILRDLVKKTNPQSTPDSK
ncbi:transposase [Cohnella cholangitidis]|uniref:Transposase n=1 Tax=Cohnella cholangitidis TaxID=2598458 RepID=A0A7G5C2Z9_9BACL|nr:transposase [Cohnella cholangitidis]QMV40055.1 transposase [Cohnella cholangitidis]QMV41629.1 transposase [Cohnella cholangitidis]QMV43583.1 transposase [Cohnella cholangitidis]